MSQIPAAWTPSLATSGTDGSVEQVRQLVPCGTTMYAVGLFSSLKQGTGTYARSNAFSFSATTGAVTGWSPVVNGQVNTVALSADCSTAYLGGAFSSVNGTPATNIAAVSTTTGAVVRGFASSATAKVNTLVMAGSHLLVGGNFTAINGSTKRYMVSLSPTTGKDDGYVNLNISGKYVYTDQGGRPSGPNSTQAFNFAMSPDRRRLLVMGVFTSVGGQSRRQIFMLDLGTTSTAVDPWYSPEFNQNCYISEAFWLRDASWSPDGARVYIATTGYKPATNLDPTVRTGYRTSEPRGGLCDVAAAFPSTSVSTLTHSWVNYTGCDSLYSTAADASTAYFGGHERWASNPLQCDNNTSGTAVVAPGMVGLSPLNGSVTVNPTRGKGRGADDMVVTGAGLWIASDNGWNTSDCGKTSTGGPSHGHAGICFLPYTTP